MINDHVPPDLLSALIDGECGAEERRAVHEHLQECGPCRRMMRQYMGVHELVAGLERRPAPESLVRAALSTKRTPAGMIRQVLSGPRRYVAGGVAAAAVVVSLAGVASPAQEESPSVDALVARHASVGAGNNVTGHVMFAVAGR